MEVVPVGGGGVGSKLSSLSFSCVCAQYHNNIVIMRADIADNVRLLTLKLSVSTLAFVFVPLLSDVQDI